MLGNNELYPSCYIVSKILDTEPQGLIKLSMKLDDYNPKRDSVELKACDYYTNSGDITIPYPSPEPDPSKVTTLLYMFVNDDGELQYDMDSPATYEIGNLYYFGVIFSDSEAKVDWHIELLDECTNDERIALEKLITVREVGPTSVSVRIGKSNKLKGKTFRLTVSDIEGYYKSYADLEVAL